MNVVIKHFGRIAPNGNISFYNESLWEQQRIDLRGREFELVIKERHKRPSVSQYSYYFGGILATCLKCEAFSHFYTVEEIHKEVFSVMFLSYSTKITMNKISMINHHTRSLSELSKKETAEFIDKVLNWCRENEIHILEADQYVNKYYREINK